MLNLILKESSKENYVITFQGVRPHGPYVMVEFYAKNFKGELLNATEAYDRLTQKGQDYTLMSFHIVTVEMKSECVCVYVCVCVCVSVCVYVCM